MRQQTQSWSAANAVVVAVVGGVENVAAGADAAASAGGFDIATFLSAVAGGGAGGIGAWWHRWHHQEHDVQKLISPVGT